MLCRPLMNEQIAQLDVSIAHVRAKQILAKELIKMPSGRMFLKKFTVLMAWAGKGTVAHFDILRQRVIKWWQQIVLITTCGGLQLQPVLCVTANNRLCTRR
ncbi:hypothetical protein D3C73_1261460 [compost metagenome]